MGICHELEPAVLLSAYAQGYFPMGGYDHGGVEWFSPRKRGLIPLDERFHIPHGMRRWLKKNPYVVRMDTDFPAVISACAEREDVWIDDKIKDAYQALHELGFAHSIEVWDEEGLQGGLYGVSLGRAFFGESMFSRKSNTSKLALIILVDFLREKGFLLLDTQWVTPHLAQFGGYEVSRKEYREMLGLAVAECIQ